jgi:hypothetical protein
MELSQYAPLPQISLAHDWVDFVLKLEHGARPDPQSLDFVQRSVIAGHAASKILDDLIV